MPGRLLIRSGMEGKNIFLTMRDEFEKGNKHRAIYEYDHRSKSLQKVPDPILMRMRKKRACLSQAFLCMYLAPSDYQ